MKRRRLDPQAPPKEQFSALRQIRTLTQAECREVVALLHEDDAGRKTCSRLSQVHPKALPCLRELRVATDDGVLTVYYMSLAEMVQTKVNTCPFYAESVRRIRDLDSRHVRFVLYADDTQGGNTLNAVATRKATLIYGLFLDFPVHYLENMWLTLCICKASDVAKCRGGLAAVLSALMEAYQQEVDMGLCIDIEGDPTLLFIPKIQFIADHDCIRAATGCKGAAAIKPCVKCKNVLALNRDTAVPDHIDIKCSDPKMFVPMTQGMVEEAARLLESQPNKKKLEEAEKFLGFKFETMKEGPLLRPSLKGWFSIEEIMYDSFHHYFSNGLIAHELGLWFSVLSTEKIATLQQIQTYVKLGWEVTKGGQFVAPSPLQLFDDKLWKLHQDFRGDGQTCLCTLPLCIAFQEDMLRGRMERLTPVLNSLKKLYEVVLCLQKSKRDLPAHSTLLRHQQAHMTAFEEAYPDQQRPKMHYSLHITEQIKRMNLFLDAFPMERKHRHYKRLCSSKVGQPGKSSFARTALLELVTHELDDPLPKDFLNTKLLGKKKKSAAVGAVTASQEPAWLSATLQHEGVKYGKGQYLLLSNTTACQILAGVEQGSNFFLLCNLLQPVATAERGRTCWKKPKLTNNSTALVEVTKNFNKFAQPTAYHRNDDRDSLWLLQWREKNGLVRIRNNTKPQCNLHNKFIFLCPT